MSPDPLDRRERLRVGQALRSGGQIPAQDLPVLEYMLTYGVLSVRASLGMLPLISVLAFVVEQELTAHHHSVVGIAGGAMLALWVVTLLGVVVRNAIDRAAALRILANPVATGREDSRRESREPSRPPIMFGRISILLVSLGSFGVVMAEQGYEHSSASQVLGGTILFVLVIGPILALARRTPPDQP